MSMNKRPRCGLCERHQRLETVDGTVFWMEYGDDDKPRLCMDTRSRGGGLNVLCVSFCPICGRFCEIINIEEEHHGEKSEHPGELWPECGYSGTAEASRR